MCRFFCSGKHAHLQTLAHVCIRACTAEMLRPLMHYSASHGVQVVGTKETAVCPCVPPRSMSDSRVWLCKLSLDAGCSGAVVRVGCRGARGVVDGRVR